MATRPTEKRCATSRTVDTRLERRARAIAALLDAMPAATAHADTVPGAVIYKVMGKMFAVLSVRNFIGVIVKCDPALADILRQRYAGIGHRGHLDPRFWISVSFDGDVPAKEVKRLIVHSYDLVCAKLTRKQKAELEALAPSR
jgi:predicted DNA-binding protein (MmcQ/YjbR family)